MTIPEFKPVAFETYKGYLLHADDPRVLAHSDPSPFYTADQLQQAYEAGKQASIPDGWTATHLKTGNQYIVTGDSIHAGNVPAMPGEQMVEYQRDGKKFVRAASEFMDKFAASPEPKK